MLSLFKLKMRTRHFSCNSNKAITADGIDCAILIESMYELYCMGLSHGLSFLPEDINQSQQYVPHRASGAAIWSWCDYLSSNLHSIFKGSSSGRPFGPVPSPANVSLGKGRRGVCHRCLEIETECPVSSFHSKLRSKPIAQRPLESWPLQPRLVISRFPESNLCSKC